MRNNVYLISYVTSSKMYVHSFGVVGIYTPEILVLLCHQYYPRACVATNSIIVCVETLSLSLNKLKQFGKIEGLPEAEANWASVCHLFYFFLESTSLIFEI